MFLPPLHNVHNNITGTDWAPAYLNSLRWKHKLITGHLIKHRYKDRNFIEQHITYEMQ